MSGISTTSMTNQPQEDPKLIIQLRDDILANEYQKPNHFKSSWLLVEVHYMYNELS